MIFLEQSLPAYGVNSWNEAPDGKRWRVLAIWAQAICSEQGLDRYNPELGNGELNELTKISSLQGGARQELDIPNHSLRCLIQSLTQATMSTSKTFDKSDKTGLYPEDMAGKQIKGRLSKFFFGEL